MPDVGTEINQNIKQQAAACDAIQDELVSLEHQLEAAERRLQDLRAEREEMRKACQYCNDCSVCLG